MAQSLVKRGSVVLIRYSFTNLTGAKVRPALVLTPDYFLPRLDDVLCHEVNQRLRLALGL
jgi:hypothetical protein